MGGVERTARVKIGPRVFQATGNMVEDATPS